MLHRDASMFEQLVLRAAEESGIEASIIEKDYYVTLFLRRITERLPGIIFKGGTSLSKCYKLINRFSEDIDLNIETDTHPTQGQRINLKESIVSIIQELGFELTNPDNVRSRRDYNRYIINYPTLFATTYLKQHLIVETVVYIRAYPCQRLPASSLIYDYLKRHNHNQLIDEYHLNPFEVNVQQVNRTLIDKVFALGDYYISGDIREHSRHIYDIYKLLDVVPLDESLHRLAMDVFEQRKPLVSCRSAKDEVDMNALLQEIIDKAAYCQDFESVTRMMLFEEVSYEAAINSLQAIIDAGIFTRC